MKHFNGLTPAQAERLALLIEELGEAAQAAGKILRHGYESRHPNGGPTNRENLEKELGDVRFANDLLCGSSDVSRLSIVSAIQKKTGTVQPFLHHQPVALLTQVAGNYQK